MARRSAELDLRIDRHRGHAEQPAARGGIAVAVARTGMMGFAMAMPGAVGVDVPLHLRMIMSVSTRLRVTDGRLVHMQAELLLGEAMRGKVACPERGGSGRRQDAQRVQHGDDHRRPSSGRPGHWNKHPRPLRGTPFKAFVSDSAALDWNCTLGDLSGQGRMAAGHAPNEPEGVFSIPQERNYVGTPFAGVPAIISVWPSGPSDASGSANTSSARPTEMPR